ncbi:MAG: hypothetical protein LBI84_03160 [Propionibacteriaceae bacterium]|jgi:hypothetical protein|nr:hypothetical protein [Propionibacteriaceae bacterium]
MKVARGLAAAVAVALTAVLFGPAPVALAEALPPGVVIADQNGLAANLEGEYFINVTDLKPGDIVTKQITIRNLYPDAAFDLTLRAEPIQTTGPLDLLDLVHLTLRLDGETLYDGRLYGDAGAGMIDIPLDLGFYEPGDHRVLDAVLAAPAAPDWGQDKSTADFSWHFYASRPSDEAPPRTGQEANRRLVLKYTLVFATVFAVGGSMALRAGLKRWRDRRPA